MIKLKKDRDPIYVLYKLVDKREKQICQVKVSYHRSREIIRHIMHAVAADPEVNTYALRDQLCADPDTMFKPHPASAASVVPAAKASAEQVSSASSASAFPAAKASAKQVSEDVVFRAACDKQVSDLPKAKASAEQVSKPPVSRAACARQVSDSQATRCFDDVLPMTIPDDIYADFN